MARKILSMLVALALLGAVAACSNSDTSANGGGAGGATQLQWDQSNWNQANWQ